MKKRKTNKAKRVSNNCRNNKSCEYCRSNRLNQAYRELQKMKSKEEEFFLNIQSYMEKENNENSK